MPMLALGLTLARKAAYLVFGSGVVGNGGGGLLMESTGYVMMEDGISKVSLET